MPSLVPYLACVLLNVMVFVPGAQAFSRSCFRSQRRTSDMPIASRRHQTSSKNQQQVVAIALTREEGKNEKLRLALDTILEEDIDGAHHRHRANSAVPVVELPCIAHADGDDFDRLAPTLRDTQWDYVCVTSPEAARVLGSVWDTTIQASQHPSPSVAVVGKATQSTLESLGIPVDFCPTRALAKTLVEELPQKDDALGANTVLYPASTKAATTLQDGLSARGFSVTRLNTYDTVSATWSEEERQLASSVQIACFGSPSAVEGWLKNTNHNTNVAAACIGETSARACQQYGWPEDRIFYPSKPGVEGWAKQAEIALCHVILMSQM